MIYKLTAEEDIRYRLMNSYPPEGFAIPEGGHIRILGEVLNSLKVRKANGKGRGKYRLEVISE